jgi:hypothetical protein
MATDISGAVFHVIALDPKNGFNGSGVVFFNLLASDCVDQNGDGIFFEGELYQCTFTGLQQFFGPATLTRVSR